MKIAIVKLSAMGDIVHAMVTLQFIKNHFPDAEIDWIVEDGFAGVLADNPDINKILPIQLKRLKRCRSCIVSEIEKVRKYAKNNYDTVIDLQGLIKSAVVARMLGFSVGFDRNSIREKAASFFYKNSFFVPYEENVILRNMKLVNAALGIETTMAELRQKRPFLFFGEEEQEKSASFLQSGKKNIVYILGSSWKSKIYPKEKLIRVIESLGGNSLLVWGNEDERRDASLISGRSDAVVMPSMTLGELKALISRADLVIGGDSGPTHFAWALNRPSITLFGPTPAQRNTMESPINKVLSSISRVDPARLNRNDFSIGEIDPGEIAAFGRELLALSRVASKEPI